MSKDKGNSFFDIWTKEGNKEEEEAYETGIVVAGVIAVIFMTSVLIVCLIDGGVL